MPNLFKICRLCNIEKSIEHDFYPIGILSLEDTRYKRTECAQCCRDRRNVYFKQQDKRDRINYQRRYRYKFDAGERRRINRRHALKAMYDITPEQENQMKLEQGHKCKVCGKPEADGYKNRLCVDHCHVTKKVRGLLCHHCNKALGLLMEDITIIDNLRKYIALHKE